MVREIGALASILLPFDRDEIVFWEVEWNIKPDLPHGEREIKSAIMLSFEGIWTALTLILVFNIKRTICLTRFIPLSDVHVWNNIV